MDFYILDVCISNACICEPNIYVHIIYLRIDKFMPSFFVYQLNSFSTSHKNLLQKITYRQEIWW